MPILNEPINDAIYASLNWIGLVAGPEERHFRWSLASRFWQRANEHEEAGQKVQADALRVLGGSISMHMRYASHTTFGPAYQMDGRRSTSIEDLGEHDIALLARAAHDAPDPWIKARFADLAVTAGKQMPPDWRLGKMAVEAYLDYASSVFGTDWAIEALEEIRRGLVLLRVYAKRDDTLLERYWAAILSEVPHAIEKNWPGLVFPLCDEALNRSREACEAIVPQLDEKAADLHNTAPQHAADWHGQAHRMHRRLGNHAAANAALLTQGNALVLAAAHSAEHQPILAPAQLTDAIRLLRRAKAEPSIIQELRDRLAQYERVSLDHFGRHEHSVDVSDYVKWVEDQIKSPDFFSALLRMAYRAGSILNIDEIERRTRENAKKYPISHSFSSSHVNADGAIVNQQQPFDANDAISVRRHMMSDAVKIDLNMRASVMVSRSAEIIYTEFQPHFHVIKEIVAASIITPGEQSETISRGLYAGFMDDWLAASVYLIPAMEPFVRMQLKRVGAHTTGVNEDGTQHERTLGELLDMPEAERFFGKRIVFELKAHLTDPDGFNLRNAYCHGLMSDDNLQNHGIMSLWWLVWRMLLFPWHNHLAVTSTPDSDQAESGVTP
jgi:hypothetical protein